MLSLVDELGDISRLADPSGSLGLSDSYDRWVGVSASGASDGSGSVLNVEGAGEAGVVVEHVGQLEPVDSYTAGEATHVAQLQGSQPHVEQTLQLEHASQAGCNTTRCAVQQQGLLQHAEQVDVG